MNEYTGETRTVRASTQWELNEQIRNTELRMQNNELKERRNAEIASQKEKAEQLRELFEFFGLEAKIVLRKKYYVVYLKEGAMISDTLNIMEAHIALMKFENVRILKDVRNSVNRRVNCEAANITKTVSAARKQIEDIEYIKNRKIYRLCIRNVKGDIKWNRDTVNEIADV